MHEFTTSQSIVNSVLNKAREEEAKKVLLVSIEIGRLTFLNPEQVEFWVKLGFEKTIASDAELHIEVIEPQISCPNCGYRGDLKVEDDPLYHIRLPSFSCPRCDSWEIKIEKGRECVIKKIEILK